VWETFVPHIRDTFLLDGRAISAPALPCLMSWAQSAVSNRPNRVHRHILREPFAVVQAPASMTPQHKETTYIALAKMCMPKLAELFLQFKEEDEVFADGTVGAVLSAYAVRIKLVRVSSLGQVWQRSPVMEDRNKLFLEYRQGDWTAD
jgi:hypothetical protein